MTAEMARREVSFIVIVAMAVLALTMLIELGPSETSILGLPLWVVWIGFVAVAIGMTLEIPEQTRGPFGYMAKGACSGALIGLASFGGVVLPYLARIGDRTMDDLGGSDMETSAAVWLGIFATVIGGSVVGAISGIFIAALRGARPNSG